MQVTIDPYSPATAYADLRDDETLNDSLRERAIARARELGTEHVEVWRAPYGRDVDRMAGFVELVRVPAEARGKDDTSIAAPRPRADCVPFTVAATSSEHRSPAARRSRLPNAH